MPTRTVRPTTALSRTAQTQAGLLVASTKSPAICVEPRCCGSRHPCARLACLRRGTSAPRMMKAGRALGVRSVAEAKQAVGGPPEEVPGSLTRARGRVLAADGVRKSGKSQGHYRIPPGQTGHNAHLPSVVFKFEKPTTSSALTAHRRIIGVTRPKI